MKQCTFFWPFEQILYKKLEKKNVKNADAFDKIQISDIMNYNTCARFNIFVIHNNVLIYFKIMSMNKSFVHCINNYNASNIQYGPTSKYIYIYI